MLKYGPEEFILKNGKAVIIKTWDSSQEKELELALTQFAKESAYNLQKDEAHTLVEEIEHIDENDSKTPSQLFLGVYDGEKLIAYVSLRKPFPDRPWGKHVAEFGLMILGDYWSQGLGNRLLEIIETIAKQLHITRLEARTRIKNQRASALYLRNKYQIEGKRMKAALVNDQYEDEYYLAKLL